MKKATRAAKNKCSKLNPCRVSFFVWRDWEVVELDFCADGILLVTPFLFCSVVSTSFSFITSCGGETASVTQKKD